MMEYRSALTAGGYPPNITLAHYDKSLLYVSWTNPGAYTEFVVELHDTSGTMHYNQPATGTSTTISKALDQDKTYKVAVAPLIGGEPGPKSSEATLIVIPPVISLLQYTLASGTGTLNVVWGEIAGADLYIASVYTADGSFKQDIPSTSTSGKLESTLDPSKQYKTTVCATASNGIVIGPSSDELAAIVEALDISLLQYSLTNGQGCLDVSWGGVAGAELYITTVYATDGSFKQNIPSTTTFSKLESTLDPSKQYKTAVYTTANNGIVLGPPSDELAAILNAPDISLLEYSLTNGQGCLDTSWSGVAGVEMYITTVYTTDGSFKRNIPSATTSSKLESTLDQSKQYKAAVYAAAKSGIVIGPASCELTALIACPGNVNLNYTGQNLRSEWIIPVSLQGRQFKCQLYKDSAKLAEQLTGDSRATFNYFLDAGAIYATRVRGENGVVKGPWTEPAPGPYAENAIYAYDALSRLKSINCHNTITITHTMDNAGNILSIQNNQSLGEVQ